MKKLRNVLLASLMFAGLAPVAQASSQTATVDLGRASEIQVLLNGKQIAFVDAKPLLKDNSVLVPLRSVSENLGANVDYKNNVVSISQGSKLLKLTVGSKMATVNGKSVTLESSPFVKTSRVYVPLRFVSDQLGQAVKWDGADQFVWIGKTEVPSIDDVVKAESLDNYREYYKNNDVAISDKSRDKVQIFSMSQLPLRIPNPWGDGRDDVIYNIWTSKLNGRTFIMMHYSGPHPNITMLTGDGYPRTRNTNVFAQTDGSTIGAFELLDSWDKDKWGIKDWDKIKPDQIKFLQIGTDSANYVFVKAPFTS